MVAKPNLAEKISRHRRGDYGTGGLSFRQAIFGHAAGVLRFNARLGGAEWADRYGWIPKGTGAESGPVTLYGYQRGLLDAMCDPGVPVVTVLKGARVGYTRCATLAIAYHLHHDPTLCAIAMPVEASAKDYGGREIAPLLRETPVLRGLLRPIVKGERQDSATYFQLKNGASVRIVGAAADDAFREYSARFLFADELDAEGWTPGPKSQGDKIKLFWTRGETFWNRKMVRGSTPLFEETSRIAKLWERSDQRRYFVPCPHCGEMQFLDWGGPDVPHGIKFSRHEDGSLNDVWYGGICGCVIEESHKVWMDQRGEWRPTNANGEPGNAGFHIWSGMSLQPNVAWPVIVREWLDAQADPASMIQPFVNLKLGRTYRAAYGQEVKASEFLERLEDYGAEVPDGVEFLTLSGDVQSSELHPRIEAAVWGWGAGLEAWLIGHFVLPGNPSDPEPWQAMDVLLQRGFKRQDGRVLSVQAACVDSGGHHTEEVYRYCNERRGRRVWAIKGRSESLGRRTKVWPRKPSSKLGQVYYMIGGNAARDWAYGSLALKHHGPRFVHFPREGAAGSRVIDEEFFDQMTRERLKVHRLGYTEWVKPKAAHEVGVCFVYAYAAVCGLQSLNSYFVAKGRVTAPEPARPALPAAAASPTERPEPSYPMAQKPKPSSLYPPRRNIRRSTFMA